MVRTILAAVIGLSLFAGAALAEEIKAVFKSYDPDAKKLTVTVDGEEKTFTVADEAKMVRKNKDGEVKEVPVSRLKADKGFGKEGKAKLTLTVEGEGDSAKVTKITAGQAKAGAGN